MAGLIWGQVTSLPPVCPTKLLYCPVSSHCESQPSPTKVKKRTSLGCNAGCPQVSVLQCSVGHLWSCLRRTQSLWLQRVPWGQLLTSGAVAASEVQEVVMRLWPAGESPWVQPQTLSSQVSGDRDRWVRKRPTCCLCDYRMQWIFWEGICINN